MLYAQEMKQSHSIFHFLTPVNISVFGGHDIRLDTVIQRFGICSIHRVENLRTHQVWNTSSSCMAVAGLIFL